MLFEVRVMNTGDRYLANLRDVNLTRTVNNYSQVALDLCRDFDLKFVAWANDVVGRNKHPVDWREGAWGLSKQGLSEQGQGPANRVSHHLFEFGFWPNGGLWMWDLRWIRRRCARSQLVCGGRRRSQHRCTHRGWGR